MGDLLAEGRGSSSELVSCFDFEIFSAISAVVSSGTSRVALMHRGEGIRLASLEVLLQVLFNRAERLGDVVNVAAAVVLVACVLVSCKDKQAVAMFCVAFMPRLISPERMLGIRCSMSSSSTIFKSFRVQTSRSFLPSYMSKKSKYGVCKRKRTKFFTFSIECSGSTCIL